MHVALFNFYNTPNPHYSNIASGLRRLGHNVWLGSQGENGNLQWHDGQSQVSIVPGPSKSLPFLRRLPILSKIMNRLSMFLFMIRLGIFFRNAAPDIIHMDPGSFHYHRILKILKLKKTRLIVDIQHINVGIRHDPIGRFKEWLDVRELGNLVRLFDFAFFCHTGTARLVAGEGWDKLAAIVPVGIDEEFYHHQPQLVELDEKKPVTFIYVGGLTRFRDLENILYAAQRASEKSTDFKITLIGPDKSDGYYHNLVKVLKLDDIVELCPPIPNSEVPRVMASFNVGLAYTPDRRTWDYQPTIKIIEYRALGLPILSFDVVTHREWVEEGVNGLLLEHSVESLAEGILRYVVDRTFLQQCTKNALSMRKGLTISDVCKMYADGYAKLLGQPASNLRETAVSN